MKKYMLLALAVGLVMTLIPVAICGQGVKKEDAPTAETKAAETESVSGERPEKEVIEVFMPESGEKKELDMEEYVICAVAAEMPAAYEEEALKAQAAASVTLARYMRLHNTGNRELSGAVISADPRKYQGYMSVDEMKKRWGDSFDTYYNKIKSAVEEVIGFTVCYNDEPILAAFHAVSSGVTESAETLWGKKVDYLVNTPSEGDKLSPGYYSSLTVSPEEFKEKIGFESDRDDPAKWIGEGEYSNAGTLLALKTGGKTVSGEELRDIFDLRSPAVKVSFNGSDFVLDVTGYGHGIGMSQYGADYYARQGYTWREIIEHYYPGTEICESSFSPLR